ncbi:MAG: signal recognition particle protein [Candidatus Marinimicrobia bacterium]|nr:signal recognition particle protein [Candidatus Neomarinimicrobiota bacterium]MBL7009768.1 signal recognition particle protein [Candidatus Neomarinimicrobiota bacterium]MBL7029828.1 signal recognition particle protein [Candidatus Neomarinimicrobiota bacterium]
MFNQLADRFDTIFRNLRGLGKITDANIQQTSREIRRVLLEADVNFKVAKAFVSRVKDRAEGTKVLKSVKPGEQFIKIIHDELVNLLGKDAAPLKLGSKKPAVILMAGLQGSGKTTTCGKLAAALKKQGKSVLLTAADVYRPAAIEQLIQVGKTVDVPVYEQGTGDPVVICQSAVEEAGATKTDVVILDTAGRLHVDGEMMTEIQEIAEAVHPVEILFVVDGMTGQDAVNSAKAFAAALKLTGTILTKLDGDARGGAAVSITEVTGVPIKFVGVSEKMDGLEVFDPKRIVDRILGFGDVVSLVAKAKDMVDEDEAIKLEKKLKNATFDLEDYKDQLKQLKKMGPLNQIVGMMPGMNRKMMKGLSLDDRQLSWTEAIICSMTPEERKNPLKINGSRRSRIAKGSGRSVQEVNQLLKQFDQMKKMMKKMGKMKLPKNMNPKMLGLN